MDRGEADLQRKRAGLVDVQSDYNDFVDVTRENFARERDVSTPEADARRGVREIEPATITLQFSACAGEIQEEIAERLIALLVSAQPVFRNVGVGLGISAAAQEIRDVIEILPN